VWLSTGLVGLRTESATRLLLRTIINLGSREAEQMLALQA